MQLHWWYHLRTTGTYTASYTIPLDARQRYLVTGALTLTRGDDYAHVYIGTVCRYRSSDYITCGIRDSGEDRELGGLVTVPGDHDLNIVEVLESATRVTVKLRTLGGRHRAEGAVYQL